MRLSHYCQCLLQNSLWENKICMAGSIAVAHRLQFQISIHPKNNTKHFSLSCAPEETRKKNRAWTSDKWKGVHLSTGETFEGKLALPQLRLAAWDSTFGTQWGVSLKPSWQMNHERSAEIFSLFRTCQMCHSKKHKRGDVNLAMAITVWVSFSSAHFIPSTTTNLERATQKWRKKGVHGAKEPWAEF